jgi:hypothetical protein
MINDDDVLSDVHVTNDDFADTDLNLDVSGIDSAILKSHPVDPTLLSITRDGSTTTVRFHADYLPDEICLAGYREQVFQLLEDPECRTLRFDLTGIKLLPSGMLGMMAGVKKRGYEVELLNPSLDVRDVLKVTRMDTVFTIRESGM